MRQVALREEFKSFLKKNRKSEGTINNYCTWIGRINEEPSLSPQINLLTAFEVALAGKDIYKLILKMVQNQLEKLDKEIATLTIKNATKDDINNWRSALRKYLEFLNYHFEVELTINTTNDDISTSNDDTEIIENEDNYSYDEMSIASDFMITSDDIITNFMFRMITQDRHSNKIFYPIYFIKQIFEKNNDNLFFENWVQEQLYETTIHLKEGKVTLKDISELLIENKKVFVIVNGTKLEALSPQADQTLKTFSVDMFRNISLDHKKALKNILLENINSLSTIQKITNEFKKYMINNSSSEYKRARKIVLQSGYVNEIDTNALKNELNLIGSQIQLQLMDRRQNTSKGTK